MSNEDLTFEKVLAVFANYLENDDCIEVIKTSHGYAVIEWDDRLGNWVQIEHCPSGAVLQKILLGDMADFLECRYTLGQRDLADNERAQIAKQLEKIKRLSQ